jgi:molecular chaperone GrpE
MRPEEESQNPVIRDRRRIDPVTGQVRQRPESGPHRGPGPAGGQPKPAKPSVSKQGSASASSGAKPEPARSPANGGAGNGGAANGGAANGGAANGGAANGGAANGGAAAASAPEPTMAQAVAMLAERTADLQRLQAEYANYRKRVERDRLAVREQALANVLSELLPVLDDIGRAREHGELTGGFKSVADSLEGITAKLGLTAYGESGDPFDPTLHEALMHSYSPDVTEPTAVQILQRGYKVGERIIRPARVAVAEPASDPAAPDEGAESAAPQVPGDEQ